MQQPSHQQSDDPEQSRHAFAQLLATMVYEAITNPKANAGQESDQDAPEQASAEDKLCNSSC